MSDEKHARILGEAKRREICAIVHTGGTREVAAHYVGCTLEAIQRTARQLPEFDKQLRHAESQHEIGQLQTIQTSVKKGQNWRAAVWTLERKYPQRYARRAADVVTVEQVADFLTRLGEIVASEVDDPALRRRIMLRLKRLFRSLPSRKRRGGKRGGGKRG
jgi:hypothetical protein